MIYEIFTYGGGDYVVEVLNAIVRVMGANSFVTALRISLLFGLFTMLFDIGINGNFTKGIKYYVSFLLAYNILFVPKVDVIITDPINQITIDRKVDNVPFGLAFMGHTISTLGNWMTEVFGMNFALPNDLQYNKNGILFGSTLIKNTFNSQIPDQKTSSNFNNYIRQCIIPAVNLKRIKTDDLIKSASIQDFLNYGKNGVLAYSYTDNNNISNVILCNNTAEITKDINTEIEKIIKEQDNTFNKTGNSSLNEINNYVLGINQSTTKTFEQNLIANAISNSAQEYLSFTGADAGATNYAITKDDIQKKQNGILQWLQAGKFLPLLKIVIETMFYSLFPIVILLTMLPNGFKIFKAYIVILITLQLWSPLYAILNLIMTLEQKYRLSSLVKQTGSQISLFNKQAIMDVASNIQTQAGVLAFCIPVLASKIVSGMQGFGEGMVSGMSSSGAFSTSQVVSEVASGNLSYGNGSFKNTSWGNENFNNVSNENISEGNISKNNISENNENSNKYDTNKQTMGEMNYSLSDGMNKSISNSKQELENEIEQFNRMHSKNSSFDGSMSLEARASASGGFELFGNGVKVEGIASAQSKYSLSSNDVAQLQAMETKQQTIQKQEQYMTTAGVNMQENINDEIIKKRGITRDYWLKEQKTNPNKAMNENMEASKQIWDERISGIEMKQPTLAFFQNKNFEDNYKDTSIFSAEKKK